MAAPASNMVSFHAKDEKLNPKLLSHEEKLDLILEKLDKIENIVQRIGAPRSETSEVVISRGQTVAEEVKAVQINDPIICSQHFDRATHLIAKSSSSMKRKAKTFKKNPKSKSRSGPLLRRVTKKRQKSKSAVKILKGQKNVHDKMQMNYCQRLFFGKMKMFVNYVEVLKIYSKLAIWDTGQDILEMIHVKKYDATLPNLAELDMRHARGLACTLHMLRLNS